jgi:surfactin synthase thioesterase subunit
MWATVRRYEGVTNREEAAKRVREGFVPLIRDHQGFVAYYWMDSEDGVMFSTSVFEDKADEEDSNRMAAEWVKENIADLLPNPPVITAGHVVAQS